MSSIRKRNDRYQVQVRRRGYAPVSKTFTSRTAAKKWIQVTEADMERGSYAPPPSVIVCEILKRYQQDILPTRNHIFPDLKARHYVPSLELRSVLLTPTDQFSVVDPRFN